MITNDLKERIIKELLQQREHFEGSDAKYAISIGVSGSQYSRIKKGETERVLSDANWISIARRLGVNLNNENEWKTANTPVFEFITAQLEKCQTEGISSLLCDLSDIGKTYAAVYYARMHKNAVYVDCSQVKSRQRLIRHIAREFGVGSSGKYADVYEDLVFYLKTLPTPLIILDEAGDLHYEAFLEVKALWNATERFCAYYMIGAEGLEEKIHRSIDNKKVGYTELFSRFGKRFGKVVPNGDSCTVFLQTTAAMIIKANMTFGTNLNKVLRQTLGDDKRPSLRRIYTELSKTN